MSARPAKWIGLALVLCAAPAFGQQSSTTAPKPAPPKAATPDTGANRDPQSGLVIDPGPNDLPRGAPSDDYLFVAWCDGALARHMQLFVQVKPQLDTISKRWNTVDDDAKDYAAQQVAGHDDVALFESAMRAAESASDHDLAPSGEEAIRSGADMWKALDRVDAPTQAYSWMNWELPERCIRVANELKNRALLMAPLLKDNSGIAVFTATPKVIVPTLSTPTNAYTPAAPTMPSPKATATGSKPATAPASAPLR